MTSKLSDPPTSHDAYYPALDGLRAAAVVAVMLYHGGVSWARGGYLGVDVFFVLSGFLITGLLVAEWKRTGAIDLARFWGRRARRLLPALLAMLAVVAGLGPFLLSGDQRRRLGGDGLAALAYAGNWRFLFSHQSYFAKLSGPSPLQHTWSLAVEEQWYLLWPPLLLGTLWLGRRRRSAIAFAAGTACLAAAASALLMAWLSHPGVDPSRLYYGTDTRAQALLAGAVLAFVLPQVPRTRSVQAIVQLMGAIGAATLIWLMLNAGDNSTWMYSGGFALTAVASGAVVAAAARPGGPIAALLTGRLRCGLGRISYGLYLWHWPVFLVLTPERLGTRGLGALAVRFAVTAVVAAASFRWMEIPVRTGRLRRLAVPSLGAVVCSGVAASLVAMSLTAPVQSALATPQLSAVVSPLAGAVPSGGAPGSPPSPGPPTGVRVLVLGDSAAFTLAYFWRPGVTSPLLQVDSGAILGCGLSVGHAYIGGTDIGQPPHCDQWPTHWREAIKSSRPQVAVLSIGPWDLLDRRIGGRVLRVGTAAYGSYLRAQLEAGLTLLAQDHAIVALLDVPCYNEPSLGIPGDVSSQRDDPRRVAAVNQVLAQTAADHPGQVKLVDVAAFLCPGGRDATMMDGVRVRGDGVHYTDAGAALTWRWLAPQLAQLAHQDRPADTGRRSTAIGG
jgi:peptidoglycan/LPS O-acetylase OafA/YrhL